MAVTLNDSGNHKLSRDKFMVPLSDHLALKEELASLRKKDNDRHIELSKMVWRVVKLEQKK